MIRADIDAVAEIQSARVYFRSENYSEFFYVEMGLTEGQYEAVLPMPGGETNRIVYYIEAVDALFNSTRTEEHACAVDEQCPEDPTAVFPGANPGIIIGALEAGAAAIPPGFQAVGIAGLVSAAGGGIGATTAVIVTAGAAGTAGVVVATGEDDRSTTTIPPPGALSTTTATAGATTSSIATTTTTTSTPSSTTTSVVPTTTTSIPMPEACFETKHLNFCRLKFDARCSVGEISRYEWEIDLKGDTFRHSTPAEVYNHDFGTCSGQTIQVRLTVTDIEGRSDRVKQSVTLPTSLGPGSKLEAPLKTSFSSHLDAHPPRGTARGFVVLNHKQRDEIAGSTEYRHFFTGRGGENEIEAILASALEGEVLWRFDFSATEAFVPGSIRVVQGQAVSRSGYSVVFRLQGTVGERVRLTYLLANSEPSSRLRDQ